MSVPVVRNATLAVARVMAKVARGEAVLVDADLKATRRAVCRACDRNVGNRCESCGCWIRAKTLLATEDCPLGYWPAMLVEHEPSEDQPARPGGPADAAAGDRSGL